LPLTLDGIASCGAWLFRCYCRNGTAMIMRHS
jgi:hypothetical protein